MTSDPGGKSRKSFGDHYEVISQNNFKVPVNHGSESLLFYGFSLIIVLAFMNSNHDGAFHFSFPHLCGLDHDGLGGTCTLTTIIDQMVEETS